MIGSNQGGVPEIIDHDHTGLLFESRNAESLYQQLKRLFNDSALKDRLASSGKEKADTLFDHGTHYRKLNQYFQALTA